MKRSEMADYLAGDIKDIIAAHKTKSPAYDESKFALSRAYDILDMIEGFGMLPPGVGQRISQHYYIINEWEPEDDGR